MTDKRARIFRPFAMKFHVDGIAAARYPNVRIRWSGARNAPFWSTFRGRSFVTENPDLRCLIPTSIPTPERLTSTLALNYSTTWSALLSFFLSTWIKITRPRSKRAAIPLLPSFEQFHLSPTPPEKSSKPGRFAKRNDSNIQSTLRESVSPRESVPCVSLGKKRPRNTRRDWNSGGSPISIEERGNIFLGEVKIGRSGYTARCTLAHWHFHRVPMSGDRRNNGRHRAHDRYVTFPPL